MILDYDFVLDLPAALGWKAAVTEYDSRLS
jgi:hypothetical protein